MKKTIKELLIIIAIFIFLNVTGLLKEVVGVVQRAVMFTGLMNPDIEQIDNPTEADYNLQLRTMDGEFTHLAEFKGKTIFLNLWATWCGPCIAEMPNINNLYNDVDKDKVVFVMLSLDEEPEKAQKFMDRKEFTFPAFTPEGGIPSIFRTGSIPTTHVISPDGKIVFTKKGTANYNTEEFRKFLEDL